MSVPKSIRLVLGVFAVMLMMLQAAYAATFDRVIVFGDSMSDNGNIYSLTRKVHKVMPLVPVLPKDPPYYEGRFSNGPVWIDDLVAALDVPLDDYAYGGAWAEPLLDSKLLIPFGIGMQVNYYLASNVLDRHTSEHLFIVWAGGNDYVQGRDDEEYATTNTVESIRNNIDWLVYYGARTVMVMNLPDLSVVPEVKSEGPDRVQNVDKLVKLHNEKLKKMVAEMREEYKEKYPDAKIIFADLTSYFNDAYKNPEKYNIKNVQKACYGGDYSLAAQMVSNRELSAAKKEKIDIMGTPSFRNAYLTSKLADGGVNACSNPDEYMFWDHIHPTRIVHNLMALDAMKILDINGLKPRKINAS